MNVSEEYRRIAAFAGSYQTPIYVYSLPRMARQYQSLAEAMGQDVKIFYAMKANPNPEVIQLFSSLGAGVVVCSAGEIRMSLKLGVQPREMVFISPGKTEADVECAITERVGMITAESVDEVKQMASNADQLKIRTGVGLRVRFPELKIKAAEEYRDPHFGLAGESLDQAIELICQASHLNFEGFHFFPGTQILDPEVILSNLRLFLIWAQSFLDKYRQWVPVPPRLLFSAGLGVDYYQNAIDGSGFFLAKLAEGFREGGGNPKFRMAIITGRFLTAEAGYYVTQIIDKKRVNGSWFLITDGGTHQISPSFLLGRYLKRRLPVVVVTDGVAGGEPVTITGNLCTPTDILASGLELENGSIGDLVIIPNTGAYSRSYSVLNFLGHRAPPEVIQREV